LPHRHVVTAAGRFVVVGERVAPDPQPFAQQRVIVLRYDVVADRLRPARVIGFGDPLSSTVIPIPAIAAWRCAHSSPLIHSSR